ncbi:MAG: hypothetical protein J3K34DRAFT_519642 [Monoraphidium minutum]|nr:MAG: hypothetical protein J3K34DRAFT_519642 [Monoraphidium minutum]
MSRALATVNGLNAQRAAAPRRACLAVSAVPRRAILSGAAGAAAALLLGVQRAQAQDYEAALAAKEARKAKLRDAAGGIKTSGKDKQVFKDSEYMVSEEARTPNVHSRQNEGAKSQINV